MPVFETHNGIPTPMVNLGLRQGIPDKANNGWVSTAEITTLQLEFKYLSHLTGDQRYWDAVEKVMEAVRAARTHTGLASIFIKWVISPRGFRPLASISHTVSRDLVPLTGSLGCPTFDWDLGETLTTSIYCKASGILLLQYD